MALTLTKPGTAHQGSPQTIDPGRARAYAAATNDDNPAYRSGRWAPPVFGVVPSWEPIRRVAAEMVPPQARSMIVHGEQDMHFHQPLVPGTTLVTRAVPHSVRVGPSGTRCTIRSDSRDASDRAVLEQYVTIFVRGLTGGREAGPGKPDHSFPESARSAPIGSMTMHIDADQPFRYREASGDDSPIHLDPAFARRVGLPGIIVHGLCTMAMVSQAVVNLAAGGDPGRLRRLAARFAKMVAPDNDLSATLYDAGGREGCRHVAFEALIGQDKVITNGWAEVAR